MSEANTRERREKVYLLNTIYVDGEINGTVDKLPKGTVQLLTKEQIKHFTGKVTKDIPEELDKE